MPFQSHACEGDSGKRFIVGGADVRVGSSYTILDHLALDSNKHFVVSRSFSFFNSHLKRKKLSHAARCLTLPFKTPSRRHARRLNGLLTHTPIARLCFVLQMEYDVDKCLAI